MEKEGKRLTYRSFLRKDLWGMVDGGSCQAMVDERVINIDDEVPPSTTDACIVLRELITLPKLG